MDTQRHTLLFITYWTPSRIGEGYYCAGEWEYFLPERKVESNILLIRDPALMRDCFSQPHVLH